jgi:hypothetical protein
MFYQIKQGARAAHVSPATNPPHTYIPPASDLAIRAAIPAQAAIDIYQAKYLYKL